MPFIGTPAEFERASYVMQQRAGALKDSTIFEPIAIIGMGRSMITNRCMY